MQTSLALGLARRLALVSLALAGLPAQADVRSFSQSGGFAFSDEVHSFDLDLVSLSDLRLWTTSFADGQADPVLALFDRQSGALLSLSDDVDSPYAQVDATQGALDAGILIADLAPGQYQVAVSVSPNLPAGSTWADGYVNGLTGGAALDSTWTVQVSLTNALPVPEPEPAALLLTGLAALVWIGRRRS